MRKAQRALALAGMAFMATATIGMSATSAFAAPGDHPSNNGGNNGRHDDGGRNGHDNNGGNNGRDNGGNNGRDGQGNGRDGRDGRDGNGRDNGNQDWSHNGHNGDRRWDQRGHDTARVAGIFKRRSACEATGWLGQKAHQWDSYDCEQVGRFYVLEVEKHFGDWHRHGRHH
jgi:hypothetical protein